MGTEAWQLLRPALRVRAPALAILKFALAILLLEFSQRV